jgi:uncharacterized protein
MKSWKRWLLGLAAAGVVSGSLVGCAALDAKQREWIFQPSDRSWWGGDQAAAGMEDAWIEFNAPSSQQAIKLHALVARQPKSDAPVLLYLHGARFNVVGSATRVRRMQELGFTVVAVDYRGFGKSHNELPSEDSAAEDARAAWDWIAQTFPKSDRYIFGHSLGGAIAIRLAESVADERGTLVEGTFTSIADVVRESKWGWVPVSALITQKFDSRERVARIGSPLVVMHGANDQVIAPVLGQRLFDAAAEPKRFILVEGGSHHSTNSVGQPEYARALREMFAWERR